MFKREKELMFFGLNPNQSSYEGLKLFLLVYFGACLFASVFTAPTYWLVQWIDSLNSTETTQWLLGKRIDIYYNRLCYIATLILLPYMMKKCSLFSISNLGLPFNKDALKTFIKFFIVGLALAGIVFTCQYFFCDVKLRDVSATRVLNIFAGAILGGLVVGFLEEVIMRCLIMRSIYTAWGTLAGVILSSLFFSYKHFRTPKSLWNELSRGLETPPWDIGFTVAWYDTIGISSNFDLIPFLTLFVFGAVLCMLYIRTKMLWAPLAMHSAIVFGIQSFKKIFDSTPCENVKYFGSAGMTNGYLALGLLILIFIALCFWQPKQKDSRE